ncbi:SCO family protein [Wielerella bovis]|uniref:SCO family protein n=1 Tax=Wielerella bovis TaxID=2917790 RepID=UPI0020191197|nr:SCO family protein [Wielerella bovis]MCG7656904.1 SCO family protein [Wielerella bovis]MCG7659127.1 SCO family protein [Wielerella bovis]
MKKLLLSTLVTALALTACGKQEEGVSQLASQAAQEIQAESPASATNTSASDVAENNIVSVGVDMRKENLGGDFTLTDGKGKPFSISSLKGKVVILAFGFTHCPDVCPSELLTYSDTLKQLGEQAKDVAVVFVSVDYERDTPDLIGKYVAQFNPEFIGLTDTKGGRDIAQIKQQFRIVSAKTEIKSDKLYNMDHTSGAYLLDKDGNVAMYERFGAEAPQIAADIRKLLAE